MTLFSGGSGRQRRTATRTATLVAEVTGQVVLDDWTAHLGPCVCKTVNGVQTSRANSELVETTTHPFLVGAGGELESGPQKRTRVAVSPVVRPKLSSFHVLVPRTLHREGSKELQHRRHCRFGWSARQFGLRTLDARDMAVTMKETSI